MTETISDKVHQVSMTDLGQDDYWKRFSGRPNEEELELRQIAVALHNWHCHDVECTWNYENWHGESIDIGEQKGKYYDKATKLRKFFKNFIEVNNMIHFVRSVNPKLAFQLIEEL